MNGKAEKDLANCTKPYVTETYSSGASRYRVWSDDWCEQGGITAVYDSNPVTITLLQNYKDTNYSVQSTQVGGNTRGYSMGVTDKAVNNFKIYSGYCTNTGVSHTAGNSQACWCASGYIN